MNELQIYLLVIGVLVIVAVLGFNRWQERKYRRQAEQRFASEHDDVLLRSEPAPERQEPVFSDPVGAEETHLADEKEPAWVEEDLPAPVRSDTDEAYPAPQIEEIPSAPAPLAAEASPVVPAARSQESGSEARPDLQTEYVARLEASEPITAHALVLVLQQLKGAGKTVRWLGQGNEAGWEDVTQAAPSAEFVRLAACLQLADRNGALQADELNTFCDSVQAVAANFYAVMDCPDKQAALAAATELDQFCADVDVLIGVNVISRDGVPFAGTKLRGLAESAGMRLMADGSFHYFNDQGATLFTLANLEPTPFAVENMKHLATHGVTFVFDVPKAVGGVQAFNQMLLAARQFTGPLSALMVDDNRKELSDKGIDKIRQQLSAIYAMMDQHHIPPGSPQAARLFA